MKALRNRDKNNLILLGLCFIELFLFILVPNLFVQAGMVMIGYTICTLVFSIIPNQAFTLPCLIIRISGLIRYIIFPMAVYINNESSYFFTMKSSGLMLLEAVIVHIAIVVYYSGKRYQRKRTLIYQLEVDNSREIIPAKFGITTLIVSIVSVAIILANPQIVKNYFVFGQAEKVSTGLSGGLSLLIQIAFFLAFVYTLSWIQKNRVLPNMIKLLSSFGIVLIYANGQGMTASNVSRWTMLTSVVVGIIFVFLLYPRSRRVVTLISICVVVLVVVFSSMAKIAMWNNASSDTLISAGSLNSYFSGSKNLDVGLYMLQNNDIEVGKTILMDTFANFPILNQFVDLTYTTPTYFNLAVYGSTISRDQICPMIIQCFEYFSVFGVIMYGVIVYMSLHFYTISQCRRTMLEKNIFIILSFYFSLVFCLNWSILLETMWIRVLPLAIIHVFNIRIKRGDER